MTIRALVRMLQLQRSHQPIGRRQPSHAGTAQPSLATIPTWQIAAIGGMAGIATAWFLWVLSRALPEYFTLAAQGIPFDRTPILLTIQLLLIAVATWCVSEVMSVCRAEMRKRLFT